MNKQTALSIEIIHTESDMQDALHIRQVVFVEEQRVDPEIEYDEFEASAIHVIARLNGKAVGTARWRLTSNGFKLERFAVLKSARGLGVGKALVTFVLGQLDPGQTVYLNSQASAIDFYAQLGFEAQGEIFYEANIPHRKMILKSK